MLKMLVRSILLLVIALLPVFAQAELSQSLTGADSLHVGSSFSLKIKSDPAISKVLLPDTLKAFAILHSERSNKQGTEWKIDLMPLRTGTLSFPRLQVNHASGQQADSTDAFRVYVLSVLAEGDTLLRDIKPVERHADQLPWWLYLLWAVLIVTLALILLLRRPKKEKVAPVVAEAPVQAVLAWEEALHSLEALRSKRLIEAEAWLEFYFSLSQILRAFLERQYHFAALEMTASEIADVLTKRKINRQQELSSYIIACDMVKFAKHAPSADDAEGHMNWLEGYLLSFRSDKDEQPHA